MVQFIQFEKSYFNQKVLTIDDFHLKEGIYWIRGENGSGKSTLLESLAGIIHFEGDIVLDNSISLKKQPIKYRRRVNFAESEPIFPDFLSGKEMIDLFISAKKGNEAQVSNLLDDFNMRSYLLQPISTYSSGMIKKLSIVLAFIGNPRLILLDEPFNTLDAAAVKILYKMVADNYKSNRTTFFLSSHQSLELELLPEAKSLLLQSTALKMV